MKFRILGPVEVVDDGAALPLAGTSQRALLALLLLNANEVVSSDWLLDELWGEEPPTSGPTALQVRVSQLRKTLGDHAGRLETRPPGYLLRVEPGELDLDRFTRMLGESDGAEPAVAAESLRAALALWRGPPLADLTYESFAQAAIVRLAELRLAALERRIEADLALGRHADLVGELESLIVEHPLRERLRGQLMLALYRSGRQAEALEVYRATRLTLVDELGIEPSTALQELERAVLQQDSSLDAVVATAVDRSMLVVSFREEELEPLLALAGPLARRPAKELVLVRIVGRAEDLSAAAAALDVRRDVLREDGLVARGATFVSTEPGTDMVRFASEQEVDLVVVRGSPELLAETELARVLASAPCDVAVVLGEDVGPGPVLVPFVGADHDWAAIELGAWAAGAFDAPLLLAGPRRGEGSVDSSRLLANASLAVQRTLGVSAQPLLLEPEPAALLAAAETASLIVVGLPDRWQKYGLGDSRAALVAAESTPVVLVRRGLRPGGLAPPATLTRFTWTLRS